MPQSKSQLPPAVGLVIAVVLWGGNNVALKQVVTSWPPIWTGATRFLAAGLILLGIVRWSGWFGRIEAPSPALKRQLWWRGGCVTAAYITVCNMALQWIPASHFALEMALSPVWALWFETGRGGTAPSVRRWLAAALAFAGVVLLMAPSLYRHPESWAGELLGLTSGFLWTVHSLQGKRLSSNWSGPAVAAHSMWRAGIILLPLGMVEILISGHAPAPSPRTITLHLFCVLLGGVVPFTLWNQALARWPVSRTTLFGNLIPVSTMAWAAGCGVERITSRFGIALAFIVGGVALGQMDLPKKLNRWWMPEE